MVIVCPKIGRNGHVLAQGRTQAGLGLNTVLSKIFYKNFIICAKQINCFRIHLLVNLLIYCKYHGMNLHTDFKEYCKWVKMK